MQRRTYVAIHVKARQGKRIYLQNQTDTYYFDIENVKFGPTKEGYYKNEFKSKTYSVTIKVIYINHR